MKRLTISLPEALEAQIRHAVGGGAARNVSRFLADAARRHLDALEAAELAEAAAALDPGEEIGLARAPGPSGPLSGEPGSPWGRLS